MPDYITPEQCESLGMVRDSDDLFVAYVPLKNLGDFKVTFADGEPLVWLGYSVWDQPPTLTNVRRLLRALRGEMSDAEKALDVLRVINAEQGKYGGLFAMSVGEQGSCSVWQLPDGEWCYPEHVSDGDTPLAAARAAAEELGVELPDHLIGGE